MSVDVDELKLALKAMIVKECDKEIAPESISNEEQLIGGPLQLDSLDALQISMAVQEKYGIRIEDGPKARRALRNIDSLAELILAERVI